MGTCEETQVKANSRPKRRMRPEFRQYAEERVPDQMEIADRQISRLFAIPPPVRSPDSHAPTPPRTSPTPLLTPEPLLKSKANVASSRSKYEATQDDGSEKSVPRGPTSPLPWPYSSTVEHTCPFRSLTTAFSTIVKKNHIEMVENECGQLKLEKAALVQENQEFNQEVNKYKAEAEQARKQLADLTLVMRSLSQTFDLKATEIATMYLRHLRLETEKADLRTEKGDLQRDNDALQKENGDLRISISTGNERFIELDKSYHILFVGAITVGSCLGIAVIVLIILLLVKMKRNKRKSAIHRVSANNRRSRNGEQLVGDEEILGKLENIRPPFAIMIGKCEKSSFNEVYDEDTKGKLVQTTRLRETGAPKMLSEGLLSIQSIYHDQGGGNAEFSTTSSDVLSYGLDNELSRGIEWWRRKEFWAGWEYPC